MTSQLHKVLLSKITRGLLSGVLTLGSLSLYGVSHAQAPITINWQTLQTLNTNVPKAQQQAAAAKLDGKHVAIPGFMVPLDDDLEMVDEFLLVPYAGACIHVPPPPPNQIIYVKLSKKVPYSSTDPILVTGPLSISTVKSPYGDVSYDMEGQNVSVTPYQR